MGIIDADGHVVAEDYSLFGPANPRAKSSASHTRCMTSPGTVPT